MKRIIIKVLNLLLSPIIYIKDKYKLAENLVRQYKLTSKFGRFDQSNTFRLPCICSCPQKVYMYENASIYENSMIIIAPETETGKFIMKRNSGAAQGLTVITGNHTTHPTTGKNHQVDSLSRTGDVYKDTIIEEDVWLGANVILCSGVKVGRGSIVGGGSVVRNNVPPYSIVFGNPAKVIDFKYSIEEILEHECALYSPEERIPKETLVKNYHKYYEKRVKDIIKFVQ